MMHPPNLPSRDQAGLVDAARLAIWRLFEEGYVDEDMATAGLLAIDIGMRRIQRSSLTAAPAEPTSARRRHRAA